MSTKKTKFTIVGIVVLLLAMAMISGCTEQEVTYTEDQLSDAIANAAESSIDEYKNSDEYTQLVENQVSEEEETSEETEPVTDEVTDDATTDEVTETEETDEVVEYTKEYSLGDSISKTLDDNELAVLYDGKITFDDEEIEVKESVVLGDDLFVAYSGNADFEDEFGADPYLVGSVRDTVSYVYTFEDDVALTDISDETPLSISVLGIDMEIVNAESGELTYLGTESNYVTVDDTVTVEEKTLTLIDVGSSAVVIDVDGLTEIVSEGQTETVNGLTVYVESLFNKDTKSDSSAMLILGESAKQTIESGDYLDEAEMWEWNIEDDGTNLLSISLVLDEKFNKLDSDVTALAVSECLSFPNEYITLCLDSVSEVDYVELEIYFDEIDVAGVDVQVTAISADDDVLEVDDENVNVIYSDGTSLYYEEDNDYVVLTDLTATIDLDGVVYELAFDLEGAVSLTDEDGNVIVVNADASEERFGLEEEDAEADDLTYNGNNVGTSEYDVLTAFGVVISEPENGADNDEAKLMLPEEKLEVTLKIQA